MGHRETAAAGGLADQPGEANVVVDVEDADLVFGHHSAFGDLHDGEEQAELADGVGEALIVDGLGDVDVGAEIVAALDLAVVVGGGEHHDRRALGVRVALDLARMSMPVMSGRLRSSRTSRWRPALASPEPSVPNR